VSEQFQIRISKSKEKGKIDTPNTQIHDPSSFWLVTVPKPKIYSQVLSWSSLYLNEILLAQTSKSFSVYVIYIVVNSLAVTTTYLYI
jgi:hypothetical protein